MDFHNALQSQQAPENFAAGLFAIVSLARSMASLLSTKCFCMPPHFLEHEKERSFLSPKTFLINKGHRSLFRPLKTLSGIVAHLLPLWNRVSQDSSIQFLFLP